MARLVYLQIHRGHRAIDLKTAEPSIEVRADGGVGGWLCNSYFAPRNPAET
jgi:hypothetical protein